MTTRAAIDDRLAVGLAAARAVVRCEARAVAALADRVGDDFARAVELVAGCKGRSATAGASS